MARQILLGSFLSAIFFFSAHAQASRVVTIEDNWVWVKMDASSDFNKVCQEYLSVYSVGQGDLYKCPANQPGQAMHETFWHTCDDYGPVGGGNNGCRGKTWILDIERCAYNKSANAANFKSCTDIVPQPSSVPNYCPARGNPIWPAAGNKSLEQPLPLGIHGISTALRYDTRSIVRTVPANVSDPGFAFVEPYKSFAGELWSFELFKSIHHVGIGASLPIVMNNGSGNLQAFHPIGSTDYGVRSYSSKPVSTGVIRSDCDSCSLWYYNTQLNKLEFYDSVPSYMDGRRDKVVRTIQAADGALINYYYNDGLYPPADVPELGLLGSIQDSFGRQIRLRYKVINGSSRVTEIVNSSQHSTKFEYNASGLLNKIVWPDGSAREYLYEDETAAWALTGILDENGRRHSTYSYDVETGVALSTELAGGVNRYSVRYETQPSRLTFDEYDGVNNVVRRSYRWQAPNGVEITDPTGAISTLAFTAKEGVPQLTSQSQSAGSGCQASVRRQEYDVYGNLAWAENFKEYRTCYAREPIRNFEVARIEGLPKDSACTELLSVGATLPGSSRRISTNWHPIWRLATRIAEPRRLTTYVYNGQPDPFNGGQTAWCAPTSAKLSDGKPLAVLCKQVEQATTDANGALGFAAAVDTSVPARVQQWAYNQYGQVLTAKDPLNNTTTRTYYSDTTADHTMGDLATVTNALNQVVARYTKYNPAGQWLEMADANGVVTTRTFDLRQRLKSTTTAGLTTSYDYWPTGLLKSVTMPDASSVSYGYDDAHRLTSVSDHLGNKITYTLDNSGNRIGESITDPTGRLARTLTRVPDALNRIQQVTGRE